MNHNRMIEQVFQFHDGELPLSQRAAVTTHLAECASCRDLLDAWKTTSRTVLKAPGKTGSEAFVQSVMRRIEQEASPTRGPLFSRDRWESLWHPLLTWPRLAMVGAVALVVLGLWIRAPRQTSGDATAPLQFAMTLVENPSGTTEEPGTLGTRIEEYFL